RELRNVLMMLADPRAQLLARQLAVDPALGERIHPAVSRGHGVLELGAKFVHDSPPGGRDDASRVGSSQAAGAARRAEQDPHRNRRDGVPEPGILAPLGMGIAGVWTLGRRSHPA